MRDEWNTTLKSKSKKVLDTQFVAFIRILADTDLQNSVLRTSFRMQVFFSMLVAEAEAHKQVVEGLVEEEIGLVEEVLVARFLGGE